MDIIISAHFGPIPVRRLASVYKSDNILSVWGLEEEKKNPGHIFLFVFIRCLWGSWKCRVAVYMAKYTLREIRHPRMFLRRHTEDRQATSVNCQLCLATHPPSATGDFVPPLNSPFPWRTQSIFNDCIDLTIGLQRTLLTAETFRSCQHFNANKSTFWHHFDRL